MNIKLLLPVVLLLLISLLALSCSLDTDPSSDIAKQSELTGIPVSDLPSVPNAAFFSWPSWLVVSQPVFSIQTGTYSAPLSIRITCPTSGAKIYYTLDGTTPTTKSQVYVGPIAINKATTLKAFATKLLRINSEVTTATYTFNLSDIKAKYDSVVNASIAQLHANQTVTSTNTGQVAFTDYKATISGPAGGSAQYSGHSSIFGTEHNFTWTNYTALDGTVLKGVMNCTHIGKGGGPVGNGTVTFVINGKIGKAVYNEPFLQPPSYTFFYDGIEVAFPFDYNQYR
jgi:hypothetical protein